MTDLDVARQAYATAKSLGASDKVILALFETGIVESNFTNSAVATDHDSVGFLQQRPSAGWGSVAQIMNVPFATTSFVKKAMANESKFGTAGALAQSVQISAFPGRYDLHEQEARALIAQVSGMPLASTASAAASSGANPLAGVSEIVKFFKLLVDPKTWFRVVVFTGGVILVVIGLFKLTGDNKLSPATKKVVKTVASTAAVVAK